MLESHHNICFPVTELCYALRSFRHRTVTTGHGECFCSNLVSMKDEKTRQLNFGLIFELAVAFVGLTLNVSLNGQYNKQARPVPPIIFLAFSSFEDR
jgi:predicted nucleic acid-binding Zn ribbon protein